MFRLVSPPIIRTTNNCIWTQHTQISLISPTTATGSNNVWLVPDAVDRVICAPDDGWGNHPKHVEQILVFCWTCISIYLFLYIKQLDALNFYNKFISSLYMFRARLLIVRRAKLNITVSGIITPIGASSWLILRNKKKNAKQFTDKINSV